MIDAYATETRRYIEQIRQDFPALQQQVHGKPLVYLDNGATTHKPNAVIEAEANFYRTVNSNVHRGAHYLSDVATEQFEGARRTVQQFIGALKPEEIVWTRGTTEGINLVAATWGRKHIGKGDRILVSEMEHHSNIVPWQMLCEQVGAELIPIPVKDNGELDLNAMAELMEPRVKLISVAHVSNSLGTVNPIPDIVRMARINESVVMVDGAQGVSHFDIDVLQLDVDFYAFSSHKLFGPTGMGVLYGKEELLNDMPPYQGGGEMIERCSFAGTTYNQLPYKFEAGTPNIAGAIGLAAAINYLNGLDRKILAAQEEALIKKAHAMALELGGIRIIGEAAQKASVFSFLLEGVHPADVGTLLDQQGIAVRTGHHCAMPLMERLGVPGTVRASMAFYNTLDEVDALFKGLEKAKMFLL
ncbi:MULTISPECIES: aminotransferase class V-fold PLP-dependent enzyme [unclassified Oceanobacter]|uniref:aminotransferase class V-fold PLP-dependent enzyme n=1 Tax=unclassified Oceanobacter TaxID=2620260 RepID=UPI0026E2F7F1|nr:MULTISPECIES: SufS family cysteine desulfurase [unclassified Oceanobacter]MDO6682175.1 SufS family cysteine desulfurase [Oceanobacter sp. 5_MG-2023]MDP2610561.1 SufS family cysteine desulfurase [Oceanobacter sp. 1_MG-2023]MDP2613830.1 SufS family cysteine desulfurase [Oceanobacter sp. 2_MG-2023]